MRRHLPVFLLLCGWLLGHFSTASAATITVNPTCSLVSAITAANGDAASGGCPAGSGADTIVLTGNVSLTAVNNIQSSAANGLPRITSAITIEGNGYTIERNAAAPAFRVLSVFNASLTLRNVTIRGGSLPFPYDAGGILVVGGSATLENVTIRDNQAREGGGISSSGTLTITNSAFINNTAADPLVVGPQYSGGALRINGGNATLTNTTISGNSATNFGGAIINLATLALRNTTLYGNTAPNGGGIYHAPSTALPLTLNNTVITDSAGGADCVVASGSLSMTNSWIEDGTCSATYNGSPNLGPLADNGGGVQSRLPQLGSGLIDAGAGCFPALDQRGVPRPQGAVCDIGAVERVQGSHALTVAATGLGAVSSTPAGINACRETGGTCSFNTVAGEDSVQLTATPDAGHRLIAWGGACSGSAATCVVPMGAARNVTATFTRMSATLTTPGGTVVMTISGSSCVLASTNQAAVSATLPAGFTFPYGPIGLQATDCAAGATLNVALKLSTALPAGSALYKNVGGGWQPWASTASGTITLSFSLVDATNAGQVGITTGDTNATPGTIDDPVIVAIPLAAAVAGTPAIPTLGEWALILLSVLAAGMGMVAVRRHQR